MPTLEDAAYSEGRPRRQRYVPAVHENRVLTSHEVAEWLGICLSTVQRASKAGQIPSFKIGTELRFLASQLKAWSENEQVEQGSARTIHGSGD